MWTLCLLQILPFAFSLQIPIEYLQHQFLHITDLHLDSFYKTGASTSSACHRKTPGMPAGEFGTPESNCDSPKRLVQDTLDYISGNFLLDFVVWTGDNARHDSDKELPRTLEHVLHENSQVSKMFLERFKVPVVPSIGNNDVHPHNLLKYQHEGNPLFAAYLDIWSPFIPMSQISTFKTLGSFITDVSDSISVVSLNTIFLFTSNSWVPDCGKHQGADLLLDWLESELLNARKSNRVILISGHVPPSVLNYKANCYARFSKLSLEYKDVIIGQLYGHMNVDHFIFPTKKQKLVKHAMYMNGPPAWVKTYFDSLIDHYASTDSHVDLPVLVSPSVVPAFNPSFRIFDYKKSKLRGYTQYFSDISRGNLKYSVEYNLLERYNMRDMSLSSWKKLARQISKPMKRTLRSMFFKYMVVSRYEGIE